MNTIEVVMIIAAVTLLFPTLSYLRNKFNREEYVEIRFLESDEIKRSSLREGEEAMSDNDRGGWSVHILSHLVDKYKDDSEVRSCATIEDQLHKMKTTVNIRLHKGSATCWTDKHGEINAKNLVEALYNMRDKINDSK